MHTDHIKYLLPDYATGKIDEISKAKVEQHLGECYECLRELAELRKTLAAVASRGQVAPSPQYFTSLLQRVRTRLQGKQRSHEPLWQPLMVRIVMPLGAAAVAVILLFQSTLKVGPEDGSAISGQSFLSDYSPQELISVYLEQNHLQPFTGVRPTQTLEGLIQERGLGDRIAEELFGSKELVEVGVSILPASQLTADLSDRDVDVVLERLGERTIL